MKTDWPQPRCGWKFLRTLTQGSSCLATLGFGTESLWDSKAAFNSQRPDIPRVMEFAKKIGLEILPPPGVRAGLWPQSHCGNPNGIVTSSPRLSQQFGATLGTHPEMETTPTALWPLVRG